MRLRDWLEVVAHLEVESPVAVGCRVRFKQAFANTGFASSAEEDFEIGDSFADLIALVGAGVGSPIEKNPEGGIGGPKGVCGVKHKCLDQVILCGRIRDLIGAEN